MLENTDKFEGCFVEVDTKKITIGDMLLMEEDNRLITQVNFISRFCFYNKGKQMEQDDAVNWIKTWNLETLKSVSGKVRDGLAADTANIDPK